MPRKRNEPPRREQPRWNEIRARAAADAEFRRGLLHDPARTLREELGIELPPGYRVHFIEPDEDVDDLFVLPRMAEGEELDDDELDAAAGGTDDPTWE